MNPHLTSLRETLLALEKALNAEIIGQSDLIRKLIITLFAGGHMLIEGVPGLGKTKTVKHLANILGYDAKRISFTPDLLPSDLTGTEIYRPQLGKFEVRKGPIFTNILLADEINRTPPKVQSALLEAMEERQVTIGNETLSLPSPFFVIATQNPLEHEGTYPLPEAELDRFFMKTLITYPNPEDEKIIFGFEGKEKSDTHEYPFVSMSEKELLEMQSIISTQITIDAKIYQYISEILEMTRQRKSDGNDSYTYTFHESHTHLLSYGASTRAGIALIRGARVAALFDNRDYITPDDIKYLAFDILRHRIGLSYEALSKNISPDTIIGDILSTVAIP